jgi:alkylated DNA repair dioxygenase AlkB
MTPTYGKYFANQKYFDILWNELDWEHREAPRLEYYCNDIPNPYTYGKGAGERTYLPRPWHEKMIGIQEQLEEMLNSKFEVCFVNGYRDGKDQLGWHADDSPEMDDARPIVVVSFGATREIWTRDNVTREVVKYPLEGGSIFVMPPGFQDTHQHRIPKSDKIDCGPRLSLTFRGYVNVASAV